MRTLLRSSLPLWAALSLNACFSYGAVPIVRHYRLAYESPQVAAAPLDVVLRVTPLRIASLYATEAIVYREDEFQVETYRQHRWGADPAHMITDLLQRDLANSGSFRAVQQGPSTLPSDYILRGEIEEIEERSSPDCTAHLLVRVLLTRARPRTGLDAVVFQKSYAIDEATTRCGSAKALVESMSRALARLSEQLQRDLLAAVAESSENPR